MCGYFPIFMVRIFLWGFDGCRDVWEKIQIFLVAFRKRLIFLILGGERQ